MKSDLQVFNDGPKVFTGTANPALAQAICDYLKIPLGKAEVFQFSNENIFVRILENIRQRDVFMVQSISTPVNTSLMELLILVDAAKRASAGRITAVLPYYGYGRTDKKDQPRVPITARLLADLITTGPVHQHVLGLANRKLVPMVTGDDELLDTKLGELSHCS